MTRTFDFGAVKEVTEEDMRVIFSRVADAVVNSSHLAEQVQALTERVNGLSDSYNTAIAHNVELSNKVEELQGKVRYLENVRQSAEIALEHQAQRLADLNLKVEQQGEAIAAKDGRIGYLEDVLKGVEADNVHKNTTIQSLLEQRDEYRATIATQNEANDQFRDTIARQDRENKGLQETLTELERVYSNVCAKADQLTLERDNLRENTERFAKEIEQWRSDHEELGKDHTHRGHTIEGLQRDLTSVLEELSRERSRHREEAAKLREMIVEANEKCGAAIGKLHRISEVLEPPQLTDTGKVIPQVERTPLPEVNWREPEPTPTVIVAEEWKPDNLRDDDPSDYPDYPSVA